MSRRHLIDHQLALLDDIRSIMDSIKTLAHMEAQRLTPTLPVQQQSLQKVQNMASDFAVEYGLPALRNDAGVPLLVVIGSERGLCGDFNKRLMQALDDLPQTDPPRPFITLGSRLGSKLEGRPGLLGQLPGASIAEDVPGVIQALLDDCAELQSQRQDLSLALLYHDSQHADIRLDPLLSPFQVDNHRAPGAPVLLNLEPDAFLGNLLQHYLYRVLMHACHSSLLAENRKRVAHLDNAVNHLGEQHERLLHRRNRLYQEDITAELEIIMLADQSTDVSSLG